MVGYGAVSKDMKGEIAGFFYRYKSVGGIEYVSDFLISGSNGKELEAALQKLYQDYHFVESFVITDAKFVKALDNDTRTL